MSSKQRTLNAPITFSGKGLHTGLAVTMTANPAPANSGISFRRVDIEGAPSVPALADFVVDTSRGTTIAKGEAKVSTIEHIMSALWTLGVDNAIIDINAPETPIMDGSAREYAAKIREVGTVEQEAEREFFVVTEPIEYRDEKIGSIVRIEPAEEFSASVVVSFDESSISDQHADLMHMADYATEIAPSRTFVFVRDVEPLLAAGLIKGGDLDNSIVLYEREMPQERFDRIADAMNIPRMDAKKLGYINHRPLVWENEPARHKLLDIIGDVSLIGKPIKGHITGIRPGHRVNNQFARMLRKVIK